MARTTTVNADLYAELTRLGGEGAQGLIGGVEAALAMGPGDLPNAAEFPVLGFHITTGDAQFILFAVSPGRLVRYEIAAGQSLTVTVPLARVSRVTEQIGAQGMDVGLELDADVAAVEFETQGQTSGQDSAFVGLARLTRTTYQLSAATGEDAVRLAGFSRAVRSAIGL